MLSFSKPILSVLMLVILVGCRRGTMNVPGEENQEIVVFAAASLTEVFGEIKSAYEAEHEHVTIIYNFAGSQTLAHQILEGGMPAMFFSANEKYANLLLDEGVNPCEVDGFVPEKSLFATNRLGLIYSDIYDFSTLHDAIEELETGRKKPVVLALEQVPVGRYTKGMLEKYLEVTGDQEGYDSFYRQVASYESDVKAVVAKVRIHEGDMGVIYRTDAAAVDLAANGLKYLDVTDKYNQTVIYAALLFSEDQVSIDFYEYVTEGYGQDILRDAGF